MQPGPELDAKVVEIVGIKCCQCDDYCVTSNGAVCLNCGHAKRMCPSTSADDALLALDKCVGWHKDYPADVVELTADIDGWECVLYNTNGAEHSFTSRVVALQTADTLPHAICLAILELHTGKED